MTELQYFYSRSWKKTLSPSPDGGWALNFVNAVIANNKLFVGGWTAGKILGGSANKPYGSVFLYKIDPLASGDKVLALTEYDLDNDSSYKQTNVMTQDPTSGALYFAGCRNDISGTNNPGFILKIVDPENAPTNVSVRLIRKTGYSTVIQGAGVDGSGNLIVHGVFRITSLDAPNNVFVAKITPAAWTVNNGDPSRNFAVDIANNGGFLLENQESSLPNYNNTNDSKTWLQPGHISVNSGGDFFVYQTNYWNQTYIRYYNSAGVVQWTQTLGSATSGYFAPKVSNMQRIGNDVIVAGEMLAPNITQDYYKGNGDAFVQKYTTGNTRPINRGFGTFSGETANHSFLDANGDIFLSGYADEYPLPMQDSYRSRFWNSYKDFILKLDSSGTRIGTWWNPDAAAGQNGLWLGKL
ncbi:MAG: hypothetical protein EBX47_09170, partial [Synechococcaceae bacterium WB8_1B_057]|nr:hypothetical protein [Synechococcaceae bacterium WB8_1B_057]